MQLGSSRLRDAIICRGLAPADIEDIERVAREKQLRKGEIFSFGLSEREVLLVVTAGRLRVLRIHEDGRRIATAGLYPGMAILNLSFLVPGMSASEAEALTASTIRIISHADLAHLVETKPKLAANMVELLARRVAYLEERLEMQAFLPLSARLAALLMRLYTRGEEIRVSHRRLAESIGASREAVTRTLDEFHAQGLVDLSRLGSVKVIDSEALARVAHKALPTEGASNADR